MEGCFVEGELTEAAINAMKKTETLRIDMQNQIGQEVNFQVPLTGFGKAFDSKGIDQETLQKMREQQARGGQPPQGAAPPAAGQGADDLKKKAEELLRQRQNAPKQ